MEKFGGCWKKRRSVEERCCKKWNSVEDVGRNGGVWRMLEEIRSVEDVGRNEKVWKMLEEIVKC